MKAYLVCCDFKSESGADVAVSGIMNKYKGIRVQLTSWIILTDETSIDIYEKIKEWHTDKDYVFITAIHEDHYTFQPANVANWLKRNVSF